MNKVGGLDVHKDSILACTLDEKGEKVLESERMKSQKTIITITRKLLVIIFNVLYDPLYACLQLEWLTFNQLKIDLPKWMWGFLEER